MKTTTVGRLSRHQTTTAPESQPPSRQRLTLPARDTEATKPERKKTRLVLPPRQPEVPLPETIGQEEEQEETAVIEQRPNSGLPTESAQFLFELVNEATALPFERAIDRLRALADLLAGQPQVSYERAAMLLVVEGFTRLEMGLALNEGRSAAFVERECRNTSAPSWFQSVPFTRPTPEELVDAIAASAPELGDR